MNLCDFLFIAFLLSGNSCRRLSLFKTHHFSQVNQRLAVRSEWNLPCQSGWHPWGESAWSNTCRGRFEKNPPWNDNGEFNPLKINGWKMKTFRNWGNLGLVWGVKLLLVSGSVIPCFRGLMIIQEIGNPCWSIQDVMRFSILFPSNLETQGLGKMVPFRRYSKS